MPIKSNPTNRVGKEIRRLLDKRGMSGRTITADSRTPAGDKLHHAQLSRIVQGKMTLTPGLAVTIAKALYTSPRVLLHLWVDDIMDKMGVPPDGK